MANLTDYDLAVRVGQNVDLLDIALRSTRAELFSSREAALESLPWRLELRSKAMAKIEEDGDLLTATVHLLAQMHSSESTNDSDSADPLDEEIDEEFIRIEVAFDLVYEISDFEKIRSELDDVETALQAFASINAMYNAWPYFREHIQATITKMALPPLTIPVFRVPKSRAPSDS